MVELAITIAGTLTVSPLPAHGIAAILDSGVNRKCVGRTLTATVFAVAASIVVPLAAVHAQSARTHGVRPDVDATIQAATTQKNPEMLEDAAGVFVSLRQFETADKLLQSASSIRASVSGSQSAEYGLSLVKLGELKSRRGLADEADALYARAAQILGRRPEGAPALLHLGISAAKHKEFPLALEYFGQARQLNSAQAGAAAMWMAVVQQRLGNLNEADAMYRDALALMKPDSAEAVPAAKLYATFLRTQGKDSEAKELSTRPAAVLKVQPGNGVYRMGRDIRPPSVVQKVEPEYSDEARVANLSGTVVLSVEIGVDGLAHNAQVVSGLGLGLDEKSIDAVSQWLFKPGTKDGQPVPVQATIEINWRLM